MNIQIDQKLKSLIPPLRHDEYEKLEENLLADGCRDPLVVWDGLLVDGHNRYEICAKHNIAYEVKNMDFKSHSDAKEWMLWNQLGRRNLTDYAMIVMVKTLTEIVEGRTLISDSKPLTNKEVAGIAGVGHDTVNKVNKIEKLAPQELKEKLHTGEITINKAFESVTGKKANKPKKVELEGYTNAQFEQDEQKHVIEELQNEVVELRGKLAVEQMDATEDGKYQAQELIDSLRAEIKTLQAENNAIKANRASYLKENAELKKQVKILEGKLKKEA